MDVGNLSMGITWIYGLSRFINFLFYQSASESDGRI